MALSHPEAQGRGAAGTSAIGRPAEVREVFIACRDGITLGGHLWAAGDAPHHGQVIINPATGVAARYYHYYARFLAEHGFSVLTYDYRGIGRSRPQRLRRCGYRWADWGERDFDAALRFLQAHDPQAPLLVVGHSFGGVLPGLAEHGRLATRMMTVGAQYGYWRDYARRSRLPLFLKWHVAMPALSSLFGYFPGKRLGWLEDLPAGVALEWAFRRARLESGLAAAAEADLRRRFDAVTAPILAIATTDDPFATLPALRRTLAYYRHAPSSIAHLQPASLGFGQIGHFGLFHARHANGFWLDTLLWLRDGINPWPAAVSGTQKAQI